jgi:hypothetical protein
MAGATTSQRAIVKTIDVLYPNGLMPTLLLVIPAKIISSQALTKNMAPAAGSFR